MAYERYDKCDRCGKTIFKNPHLFRDYVKGDYVLSKVRNVFDDDGNYGSSDRNIPRIYIENLHLCEECQNALNNMMRDFIDYAFYGNPFDYGDEWTWDDMRKFLRSQESNGGEENDN